MPHFYINDKGQIFKYRENENDYLIMTPYDKDRRFKDIGEVTEINKNKANYLINQSWRDFKDSWVFNGKKFTTKPNDIEKMIPKWKGSCNIQKLSPLHKFVHNYTDRKGNKQSYTDSYWLCSYRGRIYWMTFHHYYPNCILWDFEDVNKEPMNMVKWTNVNCIKPIFCITDKKYI